ncbi:vomeronasal type-1 receptor 90-like [Dipodomys spectabilis]|uniref:vomeronasal type-1 receptor 90-like n=1 Tax=Dipodomys spectabilis TaxID=105255 RepID=UPI001C537A14|nr:vomeronasal type-1 receptor 90-like [Dipodomys spectabilis]
MTATAGETVFRLLFVSKVCLGILGNCVLFLLYAYSSVCKPRLRKPIAIIFMHLTLVNALTIIFESMPFIVSSYGVRCFWDDAMCKAVMFLFRVTRGLSACTTTFLSAFQALTISRTPPQWSWLKSQSSACILPSLLSFWILNSVIYFHMIKTVESNCNSTDMSRGFSHPYCQVNIERHTPSPIISSIVLRDALSLVLMVAPSLYMVILLYRHRRRARHLHSPSLASQTAPENTATHTILLLVSCLVFFQCSNNVVTVYSLYTLEKLNKSKGVLVTLSFSYPTFCPFLLMKNNRMILRWITHSCYTKSDPLDQDSNLQFSGVTHQQRHLLCVKEILIFEIEAMNLEITLLCLIRTKGQMAR